MEKIQTHKYFELRKGFEDETQLKIGENKDVYIRYLETTVLKQREQEASKAVIDG